MQAAIEAPGIVSAINADIVSECARELSFLDPTALKTETIEIDKFSSWEPPQTYKLLTETGGAEKEEQKEPTIEKMHNNSKSFKNEAYQRTGSFIEKNRQRLISAGLATAIVLLAVVVSIGVNTGSNVKTEQSIQADQTILVEKKHAPNHHAELSMPHQPADNAESASEKSMQYISSESQQLLNKETAEKVVAPKNEITPVKLGSKITAIPSLGNTPPHEAKLKTQNKLPGARSAEFTPKKITKVIYPTTLELATAALERQNF